MMNLATTASHGTVAPAADAAGLGQGTGPPQSLATITAPKGGGAIRGIDEKFATNAGTGAATLSVPIPASPSRAGFHPSLSLTYGSGNGNGPFGLGWYLAVPSITRKTDKGIPIYADDIESDVFVISGAEDLVPLYKRDSSGAMVRDASGQLVADEVPRDGYVIHRYGPRIESSFNRVEKWTHQVSGVTHWRTITGQNVTTLFGVDDNSRIADPDTGHVFSWLMCQTYDDKGNAMTYEYKAENSQNVDTERASEGHRSEQTRSANRYLKSVRYGNKKPNRDSDWKATDPSALPSDSWMFEVVFDFGEHSMDLPTSVGQNEWASRKDPFSSYRSGFEVRTYRLCRRVLVFHHFAAKLGTQDCLVRSLDLTYDENSVATFLTSITSSGFVMQKSDAGASKYLKKTVPPIQLEYTKVPDDADLLRLHVRDLDATSLENLPQGGASQLVDLDGEGLPGALSMEDMCWLYKRNASANNLVDDGGTIRPHARLMPLELVTSLPAVGQGLNNGQLLDLAGDGLPDLVLMDGPLRGFFGRERDGKWGAFRPFVSFPNIPIRDPNCQFIDLTGDGFPDILVSDDEEFFWYQSLAEAGFGPAQRFRQEIDEEKGPRLVFANPDHSIFRADISGDGLTDLVRIRNGEVCYWPNMGYGRFGQKIYMENAPIFESYGLFNPSRVHLADIDGSGTADILYFGAAGADIYRNQSGNGFSQRIRLDIFAGFDLNMSAVSVMDLLGSGTACIVISSRLPSDARKPLRYLDLMDGQKPHLLSRVVNNLGAETRITYAPSTRFYLQDKQAGKPWLTRLAFPVHCVERVESYDWISKNRFVSRYAYHHGYFDNMEREFRGFGMVEQWDTEEIGSLTIGAQTLERTDNELDAASYVPPAHLKSWFHTGAFIGKESLSRHLAGEYYPMGRQAELGDSIAPSDSSLTAEETREAYRSLKGCLLRTEMFSDDFDSPLSGIPYLVSEQNYLVSLVQPRGGNRHAVFFTHSLESLRCHCERMSDDGRQQHDIALQVDLYGNVLKSLAIVYGRQPGKSQLTDPEDLRKQEEPYITLSEIDVTNPVYGSDDYRLPAVCETRMWEITGLVPANPGDRFTWPELADNNFTLLQNLVEMEYENRSTAALKQKRLIGRSRTLYRSNDLTGLLPLGQLGTLGLIAEGYKLALTPGLLSNVFRRRSGGQTSTSLLADAKEIVGSRGGGAYVDLDNNGRWWIPAGRQYFHVNPAATPAEESAEARSHFFVARRHTNQFGHSYTIEYDTDDLLLVASRDALGNATGAVNDYRVLQPSLVTDANANQVQIAFDALGLVAGTAVMGKAGENVGDNLVGFAADLNQSQVDQFFALPKGSLAASLLGNATSRNIYHVSRYWRETLSANSSDVSMPVFAATLSRESHLSDPMPENRIQVSFAYSDGFGRVLQTKAQAEPGAVDGDEAVNPRWTSTGWAAFNNKGKPVKRYEPFFDRTHDFAPGKKTGVGSTLFYDPMGRVVATLHPNHTWEKKVFGPWQSLEFDVNDTAGTSDPRTDVHVGSYFTRLPAEDFLPSWIDGRRHGELGPDERSAAIKALEHANTPGALHLDALGRTFLKIADNGNSGKYASRVILDVQGNHRKTIDAKGRDLRTAEYDMLGALLHEHTMEGGERWYLRNSAGKTLITWDSRGHKLRNEYDPLSRETETYLSEDGGQEIAVTRKVYGESLPLPQAGNHCGQVYRVFDQAGIAISVAYDFKGNLVESRRQLWQGYKIPVDTAAQPPLEQETHTTSSRYDALNRTVEVTTPDGSRIQHTYNDASLLDRVRANVRGASAGGQLSWTNFISNIDYTAKGQRATIEYSNGALCSLAYDPLTFRLTRMKLQSGRSALQDLNYTYDPVGNITTLRDNAIQAIFFRNTRVEPTSEYTYDALYRLSAASGREHLGQTGGRPNAPTAPTSLNGFGTQLLHPGDGNAMGRYVESFGYDQVGNILSMKHEGSDPANPGWTRDYTYDEKSTLDGVQRSNRLSLTSVSGAQERYSYDAHGNVTEMPHLSLVRWDYHDHLGAVARQVVVNGATPETTYYVYDEKGKRVRKVTERAAAAGTVATKKSERIYLGDVFEVYREFRAAGSMSLERETLHIVDDQERLCLVETRTAGTDQAPQQLIRYSHGNHLGSVALELDSAAQIISYEEYFPYGGTSYQATRNETDTPKRHRYTGKERDEESGFYYNGARYYACWLGRWTACDPAGLVDGSNLYQYVQSNPIATRDPHGTQGTSPFVFQEQFKQAVNKASNFIDKVGNAAAGVGTAALEFGEGVAVMEILPPLAIASTAKQMYQTSKAYDHGTTGFLMAVNQVNPLFHAMVNTYEAYEANERGDTREAFRRGTHAIIATGATVALVAGGAGMVEGIGNAKSIAKKEGESMSGVNTAAKKPVSPPEEPVPAAAPPSPPSAPKGPVADPPPVTKAAAAEPLSEAAIRVRINETAEAMIQDAVREIGDAIKSGDQNALRSRGVPESDIQSLFSSSVAITPEAIGGRVVEHLLANKIANDSFMNQYVRYTSNTRGISAGNTRIDFVVEVGGWRQFVDLSTPRQIPSKVEKFGEGVLVWRWKD